MGTLSSRVLKQIEELSGKADGLTGVPSGFTNLDRITSGWQPSDLVIIAAFGMVAEDDLDRRRPKLVFVDERNRICEMRSDIPVQETPV